MKQQYIFPILENDTMLKFKKKKVVILILAVVLIVAGALLFFGLRSQDDWEPPMDGWWMSFDSIEEINRIRTLLKEGNESELLEFIKGTNNGENIVNSKRDVEEYLKLFDDILLPNDPNWTDCSYHASGNYLMISYIKPDGSDLWFMIYLESSFDDEMRKGAERNTDTDVTDKIAAFANQDNKSLRIGNGIQAFSYHRHDEKEGSIRKTKEGFEVCVSLNVEGRFISAGAFKVPSFEAAYEILANVEFVRGAW